MKTQQYPGFVRSPSKDRLRMIAELEQVCGSLNPGDRIPTHTELMVQFKASERMVMHALRHLQSTGKLVRRQGAGTFIAMPDIEAPKVQNGATMTGRRTLVLIADIETAYLERGLDLLLLIAEVHGHAVVCCPVRRADQLSFESPVSDTNHVSYIVLASGLYPLAQQLFDNGNKVVLVGSLPTSVRTTLPCVYADHEHGGYLATQHLIDLGHRRIAYVHKSSKVTEGKRWAGHHLALRQAHQAGMEIVDSLFTAEKLDPWLQDSKNAARDLREAGAPTGLVVWNDESALTLLSVLQNARVEVPGEVSIIGYDNLPESELVYPKLSSVDHGLGQQIRAAVNLLTDSSDEILCRMQVVPTLIARSSTGKPPEHFS